MVEKRGIGVEIDTQTMAVHAFLQRHPVRVTTATREFEGTIFQLFHSAYEDHLTAGVVEKGTGLVHFFRATKSDCKIERLDG